MFPAEYSFSNTCQVATFVMVLQVLRECSPLSGGWSYQVQCVVSLICSEGHFPHEYALVWVVFVWPHLCVLFV